MLSLDQIVALNARHANIVAYLGDGYFLCPECYGYFLCPECYGARKAAGGDVSDLREITEQDAIESADQAPAETCNRGDVDIYCDCGKLCWEYPDKRPTDEQFIAAAQTRFPVGGLTDIRSEAAVEAGDDGAWVEGWVWISDEDARSNAEKE